MKKGKIWIGVLVCLFALIASGCATNVGPNWRNVWFVSGMDLARHDYTILGQVTVEREWMGILGFGSPIGGGAWFFQRGGITHHDVLTEARRQFPGTDDVVQINLSSRSSNFGGFFASRTLTATGLAIRFSEEQRNARRENPDYNEAQGQLFFDQ